MSHPLVDVFNYALPTAVLIIIQHGIGTQFNWLACAGYHPESHERWHLLWFETAERQESEQSSTIKGLICKVVLHRSNALEDQDKSEKLSKLKEFVLFKLFLYTGKTQYLMKKLIISASLSKNTLYLRIPCLMNCFGKAFTSLNFLHFVTLQPKTGCMWRFIWI